jgi:hypothetical protein
LVKLGHFEFDGLGSDAIPLGGKKQFVSGEASDDHTLIVEGFVAEIQVVDFVADNSLRRA